MNWIELKKLIGKLQDEKNPNRLNCLTHAPNCQQDRKLWVVPLLLWSDLTSIHYLYEQFIVNIVLYNFLRWQLSSIQNLSSLQSIAFLITK